jgi:ribose 5-phosphate isomerase A
VERIIQQGPEANKCRVFIPSGTQLSSSTGVIAVLTISLGFQSKQLIVEAGLRLGDVDEYPTIDVTLDGADEQVAYTPPPPKSTPLIFTFCRVDYQLNCVKGGGACHLREKVLAEAANTCAHFYNFVEIFFC